ncbi:hypothetical protein C2S52_006603 [Perilla frutescens var. hirtella]|nr:hypothetical protein C2S52_006603 [Perilla frutescens var. hirtella]
MKTLLLLQCFLTLYCITTFAPVSSQCLEDQKHLLLGVKSGLIFDASASNKLVRWNRTSDCCSWDGVKCDGAGHVIGLQLDEEAISGGIENSENLFSLGYLEKLNLAYNYFDNIEIPKGLKNLANLTHLNLSHAGFAGQVPSEILRLRSLVSLDLSAFSSDVPLQLKNPSFNMLVQNLTGLRELYLDWVNISSRGREWCQVISSSLPDLTSLSLRWCFLSGPIDLSLTELRSLSVLLLDGNVLASSLPYFLANFSKLTTLSLASCSLQGTFPEKIFQIPTLQHLDVSYNELLSGALPQFPPDGSLRTIVLSHTGFSGSIPETISNLAMLSRLDLSNCSFTGPIPPGITNLTQLDYLDLSLNNFTGSIPLFHLSKKLTYLDVSHNRLIGLLSSRHFQGLSNIVYINLGNNLLNGNIPSSLFALPALQKLHLSNNEFHGQVEEVFNSSSSLLELDLSSNCLGGPIPRFFTKLERLAVLSLSSNAFNGTVQLEMFNNPNLARLELSFNDLVVDSSHSNSSLPVLPGIFSLYLASCKLQKFPQLRGHSRLITLDLSSNQLKGDIPNWIWEIGNGSLTHLNLSLNQLHGFQKPYKFPDLLVLDLHSNQLQGQLPIPPFPSVCGLLFQLFHQLYTTVPTSICNGGSLAVLDLSSNALTGTIPPCLLKIWALGVLNLGRNNLSGHIPDVFSDKCSLKTLDLNKNVLGGRVPGSLVNCPSLEVLNIGNNRIEDTFPCMLMETRLRVLILRSNKFYGDLQCLGATQGWSDLQIIDISTNNFSGNISLLPFSNLTGMINVNGDEQSQYDHLHFDFLILNGYSYQDAVAVTMKGLELELKKILIIFTSIDFSSNNLSGELPSSIGDLKSLYLLNISHNSLTGTIPASVGNLRQLGSLDLSFNHLTGKIPVELASLTFISFLNLSWNKLFGMIPKGPQFQTFSGASFEGNTGLCGFPLEVSCNNEVGGILQPTPPQNGQWFPKEEIGWSYVSAALGYVVGLGSTVWILLFCRRWRETYFEQVDRMFSRLFPQSRRRRS